MVIMRAYEGILLEIRDLIHTNHKLLAHPQASNLKPSQTPYRTTLLYSETGKSDARDIRLIEEVIRAFNKWIATREVPKYDEKIAYDYKTIDLLMMENVIPKLQGQ